MRVNIYNEELTGEVEIIEKHIAETDNTYFGVRVFLASSDKLHHEDNDDDRSAVTFWLSNRVQAQTLATVLSNLAIPTGDFEDTQRPVRGQLVFSLGEDGKLHKA